MSSYCFSYINDKRMKGTEERKEGERKGGREGRREKEREGGRIKIPDHVL